MSSGDTHPGRLEGKVAVITGAASGIGEGTARLFVAEGACVVLADIQDDRGERLASALGPHASYRRTDVTREEDIRAAVAHAVEKFGRLDCLFNNAGSGIGDGAIADIDAAACRHLVDLLLVSVVLGMKHAAPVMRAQHSGTIINTASVGGLSVGLAGHVYSACKAGVIHLTRSVANELAEDGIRVNAIAPGGIATPIFGRSAGLDQDQAEVIVPMIADGMAKTIPLQRAGFALDVAEAALWLASDQSSFITADCLVIDGGITTGRLWSEKMAALQPK